MTDYQLGNNLHIAITPAGAYYAVSEPDEGPARRLLRALLRKQITPALSLDNLKAWTGLDDDHTPMDLLYRAQALGWLEGLNEPMSGPVGALEDILPELLPALSGNGKALLADNQGFYICAQGFTHEAAEELSALSADIASMHERHLGLLKNNLGLNTGAWSLVDAAGNSQLGFWPLHIGEQRFVLVVAGVPRLNQPALTQLVWALSARYGA